MQVDGLVGVGNHGLRVGREWHRAQPRRIHRGLPLELKTVLQAGDDQRLYDVRRKM